MMEVEILLKKRLLIIVLSITVLLCAFICIYFVENNRKIPFLPIAYQNVTSVSLVGNVNKTYSSTDVEQLVNTINERINDGSKDQPVNHSTPEPTMILTIKTNDHKFIPIYKDYDGKYKISDGDNAYIIRDSIIKPIVTKYCE